MANFLNVPKTQFFDGNGNPLTGGKVYVYEPGTTNNKNSYSSISDAASAINPNTNPVILDSRGEAALVLNGLAKLVVTDSSDTTIYTVDNVSSEGSSSDRIDSNGNEQLLFSEVSSAVNYIELTNAVTTSAPSITSAGDDTNPGLTIKANAAGQVTLASQDVPVTADADTIDLQTGGSSRADLNDSGLRLGGANARVTTVLDEDDMSSDSATALATQQSIKAYALGTAVIPSIWAAVSYSGGTPSLDESLGVSSVSDIGTGEAGINYTSSLTDNDYGIACAADSGTREHATTELYTGSHSIVMQNGSGGSETDRDFYTAVFDGD